MDYRSLRPSNRSEVQPLHGDLGAPPASSSGTTTGAARSGGNKMERPSRSCYGVSDEKPLAHPQKWAIFSLVAPAEPSAPAREHIKKALAKCRAILQDGRIFVTQQGEDFPRNFRSFVSHILVQLLQMYCHIYRQHFDWLLETDTVAHVNCCFKHALYFGSEFRLVKLEDVAPIKGLALHFLEQAQRDIAEAEASEGKQHPANAKHKQQQQQQQQQPQLQQHQAQQDKR